MSNVNMFEVVTRSKIRFPYKGSVSVEDLWDLTLSALDSVFKTLNSQIKQVNEESLLTTKTKEDEVLETQIAIVKYIFNVKAEEANEKLKAKERKEEKQRLLSIKATKQNETLQNSSIEELDKMIAALD